MDDRDRHTLDLSDPMSETVRESRLILRFYDLWAALAGGRPYPALTDFSPDALRPFKPHAVLIDLQDGYDHPILKVVGEEITRRMKVDYRGRAPADVPRQTLLSRITDHYLEVLANKAPVGIEAEFRDDAGLEIPYRAILAPLSRTGDAIDFILCVVNWKNGVEADADNPPADLNEELAGLCEEAAGAGRSRQALYELLAHVLRFWRHTDHVDGGLDALLAAHGLKAQKRAPFTALLKLVFGPSYDKTRLTEYAAALAHAHHEGWKPAFFLDRLVADGGMKAMVRAERRRRGKGGSDTLDGWREALADLPAISRIAEWPASNAGDHALLLLARREPDGGLAIVAADSAVTGDGLKLARRLAKSQVAKNY